MECRVTAEGASYEFTEESLWSAQIKSCKVGHGGDFIR